MFIGHIPAGYLLTTTLQDQLKTRRYMAAGLLASVLPDVDILYFYLVDNRQSLHHSYWVHIPFYWLIASAVTFVLLVFSGKKKYFTLAVIFFGNIFLHLFLDTIVGKIEWLYPFSEQSFSFFEVPARYEWWVANFIFHWTFLFEIAVTVCAIIVFTRRSFRKS